MNMTDYLLTTSVTAEALSPVFEEAVRVTCCKDYTPSQVEAWVQRATSSRWRELLSGDLHFLAAVSQPSGEVAGFISVRGDGYLHSLFVHPAHQRRGVASFLLRAAEEEARRSEAPDLFSEVSLTAKPFFLSQGFSVEQEQTMRVNGVELTNFRMRKPLIYQPDEADFDELLLVWEEAVRSTHHFLSEEDIEYYKPLVRMIYLPGVDLYCIRNREERIAAFMGLSGERIEMLFVAPQEQRKGYGSRLIDFAVRDKYLDRIDVNEQNSTAVRFYLKKGFEIVSRDAFDGAGRPFPVQPRLVCDGMRKFYRVAYGIDRFIGCLQVFVYINATHFPELQSGFGCQTGFGPYTDREQYHFGIHLDARLEVDADTFGCFFERFYGLFQIQPDPFLL